MVKVKDTASFIEAARAVHGDKYDYSSTVYSGSQKPITIICKKCGLFVLAEAGTHYWKKACGCRSCEIDAMLERKGSAKKCNQCGARLKYSTKCDCPKPSKKYKTTDCAVCGTQFRKVCGKSFCSKECRDKLLKSRIVETQCCNCGKSITKRVYRDTDKFCCSNECQRIWAGSQGVDWLSRSKKAKEKWKSDFRNERQKTSVYVAWERRARQQRKVFNHDEENPWKRRCASARAMLAERLEPAAKKEKATVITDWIKACNRSHKRFLEKVKRSKASPWMKKITTVESSMRKRRQLRNAKRST